MLSEEVAKLEKEAKSLSNKNIRLESELEAERLATANLEIIHKMLKLATAELDRFLRDKD